MNVLLLFIAAIGIPVIITLLLVAPVYIAIFSVLYVVYGDKIWPLWSDIERVTATYLGLYEHWQQAQEVDFFSYTLPLFGLPIIGVLITCFLAWRFVIYIKNIFVLTT